MGRSSRNSEEKVSFFAFQDIITAVTGILVLVTLILTLFVNSPASMWDGEGSTEDPLMTQLREIQAQLKEVNAENRARQLLMSEMTTAPSPERLDAEMDTLRADINAIRKELEVAKQKLIEQELDANILAREMGLGRKTEETVKVEEVVQKNSLWLVRDFARDSKQNMLVVLDADSILVRRFGSPEGEEVFSGANAPGQFFTALKAWDPEKTNLVFYIRPSGIRLFHFCVDRARNAGFTVGFDAITEDQPLDFDQG